MKDFFINVFVLVLLSFSVLCEDDGSGEEVQCEPKTNKEALCKPSCTRDSDCDEEEAVCKCDGDCGASCISLDTKCYGKIPRVKNARRVASGKEFGDTVKYTCRKPYTISGDDTIMCRGLGIWDRNLPKCQITCPDPGVPKHVKRQRKSKKILASPPVGTTLEYWCMPGFEHVSGNTTIKCLPDGVWSGSPPVCKLKSCEAPDIPDHAIIRPKKDSYNIGERVAFSCETGFSRRGVMVRECRSHGWTSGVVTCSGKSCGDPGEPMNGKRIGLKFQYKSIVKFQCDEGYMLEGPRFVTCQSDQNWSGPTPRCKIVDCGMPPIPYHGEIDGIVTGTSFGSTVRLKCKAGYMLRGPRERKCQGNGTWSGLNTKCSEYVCLRPTFDGTLEPDREEYRPNTEVKFSCDGKGTIRGSTTARCIGQGDKADWNTEIPKCYDCKSQPLGFENKNIRKEQLSQGEINIKYKLLYKPDPDHARLNGDSAWCPHKLNNMFLEIDLSFPFTINAIATQGDPDGNHWVQYYVITYSNDKKEWFRYQEDGEDKVFIGNTDRNTIRKNVFKEPLNARYIRVLPLGNPNRRNECMRIELYGCIDPKECIKEGSTVWFQERAYGRVYTKGVISQINQDTVNIIHHFPDRAKSPATIRKDNPVGLFMDKIVQLKDVNIGDQVITIWRNRPWYYIALIKDIGKVRSYNQQYDGDGMWTLPAHFRARKVHPLQFC